MDFKKLLEAMDTFAGERVGQKPGDQVRGTDKAAPNKGRHPFLKRLVGELKQPKSVHKYEQELSEAWLEFQEAAPVAPTTPGATPATTAATAPGQPPKSGTPVDPAAAAAMKTSLQKLKTAVPGLDITKASTTMAKADTNTQLNPADQAVVGKMAPQLANVVKNPQMAGQLKMMIDKANQQDAAATKKAASTTTPAPTTPGAPVPPAGTQLK
jgi:hypothetical protein